MDLLKVLSRLLDYPVDELQDHLDDLEVVIQSSTMLTPTLRQGMFELIADMRGRDWMEVQERYDGLFERGRATSLLLFEHVHGDSRDRGQAMVDLMALYHRAGFAISVRELPDYLPLYLEFLATRPTAEIQEGLSEVAHIIALIGARLEERGSLYHMICDTLVWLAEVEVDNAAINNQVAQEQRDDTLEALDQVWEEEMVTFATTDPNQQCKPQTRAAVSPVVEQVTPVHWVSHVGGEQR